MKKSLTVSRIQAGSMPPVFVTYVAHRKVWLLAADYKLRWNVGGDEIEFLIPINFEFDLASIPRVIWPIISSFELSIVAPLIHDYLYQYRGASVWHQKITADGSRENRDITRKEADLIFWELMVAEGVPSWKAKSAHRAVRIFASRW